MRLDKNKIQEALKLIYDINHVKFEDLDFSDIYGKDLTKKEKDELIWSNERKSNIQIIDKIINKI